MQLFFTPITTKNLNAQVISNTCRPFISNFVTPYNKYGSYVYKPPRAHKQITSFSAPHLKRTQNVRNTRLCSSCVPNLIKMGGEYISRNLFLTFKRLEIKWSKTTVYGICQEFGTVKMHIKVHLCRSLETTGTDFFLRCDIPVVYKLQCRNKSE